VCLELSIKSSLSNHSNGTSSTFEEKFSVATAAQLKNWLELKNNQFKTNKKESSITIVQLTKNH
jgi:hypothetical protein